jgi:hypothetical protein
MFTNETFFQVFGHISVFFATWDFIVSLLISRLSTLKPDETVNPELLARVQPVLPTAIEISNKRNRFIHDQWVFKPDGIRDGVIHRFSLRLTEGPTGRLVEGEPEKYTLPELYEFLNEIGRQQEIFAAFLNELPQH